MPDTLIRTFLDSGVLITGYNSPLDPQIPALAVLKDPRRIFLSSPYVWHEVCPKALFNGAGRRPGLHFGIGPERVRKRVKYLGDYLRAVLGRVPKAKIFSPRDEAMCAGITVHGVEGVSGARLQDAMWTDCARDRQAATAYATARTFSTAPRRSIARSGSCGRCRRGAFRSTLRSVAGIGSSFALAVVGPTSFCRNGNSLSRGSTERPSSTVARRTRGRHPRRP